jgi:hypothetical protein
MSAESVQVLLQATAEEGYLVQGLPCFTFFQMRGRYGSWCRSSASSPRAGSACELDQLLAVQPVPRSTWRQSAESESAQPDWLTHRYKTPQDALKIRVMHNITFAVHAV